MVWLEGLNPAVRTVKKVYSVETEILQAFWCRFRSKNSDKDRGRRSTPHGDIDGGDSGREKTERCQWRRFGVHLCEGAELSHSLPSDWSGPLPPFALPSEQPLVLISTN